MVVRVGVSQSKKHQPQHWQRILVIVVFVAATVQVLVVVVIAGAAIADRRREEEVVVAAAAAATPSCVNRPFPARTTTRSPRTCTEEN